MGARREHRARESGQVTVLIIGFALVLLMAIALVVDSSAAYLQRQGLDTLADGAALHGADLGSVGAYQEGIPQERLLQTKAGVHQVVGEYLHAAGAYQRYPGLKHQVYVDPVARVVRVTVRAPLELPLRIPGGTKSTMITATGTAAVTVLR